MQTNEHMLDLNKLNKKSISISMDYNLSITINILLHKFGTTDECILDTSRHHHPND